MANNPRPVVKLIGADGNAFMVLGLCMRAAKKARWTEEKIKTVFDDMKAVDYNHLLAVALREFEVS